jgi:hypothetical protein
MPVILDPDAYDLWLDPGMTNVAAASELLKPYDATSMRSYPVSTRINHVANDDEDCVVPWNSPRFRIGFSPSRDSPLLNDVAKSSVVLDRELDEEKSLSPSGPRIRCPLCGWSPHKEDHWSCTCGHEWNTFDTGGVCPACLHQWTETQCLSCSRWSAHSLWYAPS